MAFLNVCIKVDLYQDVKVAVFQLIVYQIVNKRGHHIYVEILLKLMLFTFCRSGKQGRSIDIRILW